MDDKKLQEYQEEVGVVIDVLEDWGKRSRFIWFREMDRLTKIDRGLLRNILSHLRKNKEVVEVHGQNKRIFFVLAKYHKQCHQAETEYKGKSEVISDEFSKVRGLSRTQKSINRTKKRIEKQQKRREVKLFARAKHQRQVKK